MQRPHTAVQPPHTAVRNPILLVMRTDSFYKTRRMRGANSLGCRSNRTEMTPAPNLLDLQPTPKDATSPYRSASSPSVFLCALRSHPLLARLRLRRSLSWLTGHPAEPIDLPLRSIGSLWFTPPPAKNRHLGLAIGTRWRITQANGFCHANPILFPSLRRCFRTNFAAERPQNGAGCRRNRCAGRHRTKR